MVAHGTNLVIFVDCVQHHLLGNLLASNHDAASCVLPSSMAQDQLQRRLRLCLWLRLFLHLFLLLLFAAFVSVSAVAVAAAAVVLG